MKIEMHILLVLLVCSGGLEVVEMATTTSTSNHTIMKGGVITKPGCPSQCGDLTVPYPFGIRTEGLNCSLNPSLDIVCNKTTNPPKAFIEGKAYKYKVTDISDTELRIPTVVSRSRMYDNESQSDEVWTSIDLQHSAFMFSEANVLTTVGCNGVGYVYSTGDEANPRGCLTLCSDAGHVTENECSGAGCCQAPADLSTYFHIQAISIIDYDKNSSFSPYIYTFYGEKSSFKFRGVSDLNDPTFINRTLTNVPIVLDWVLPEKKNCATAKAAQESNSYACISTNSLCVDVPKYGGYRCSCKQGYEGNPYLYSGCKDIDECKDSSKNVCMKNLCINTPGNYTCSCPHGYNGDGRNCILRKSRKSNLVINLVAGVGITLIFIIIGTNWLYCLIKKRQSTQLRERLFQQNGGLLLKRQSILKDGGTVEAITVFTDKELKKATNNYASDKILGRGGSGIVYKGILADQRVVAIKKSKIMDKSQIEQFINELVILTQVNHRNVVKLLGFCLECEVPMLVYEFVSNGTLFHHVHGDAEKSWLSLENRLRIAAESSGALAYLHSAASLPILHRDVKLANILLDDNHVAKISDFGASRLVPLDQTQVTTLVQGTLGYLDPECFHTGKLTDKSDVYSFGVVLAELLTSRKPLCMERSQEETNLATYFIASMKENRLFRILEPRVVREGTLEQLEKAAQLVKRCLSLNGEDRPTMKEVAMEIESLMKYNKHPWTKQHGHEETTSLLSSNITRSDLYEIQSSSLTADSDLYEVQLSSSNNFGDGSEYSVGTTSLLLPSSSPR